LLRSAPLWPEGNCATGRCTIASHHRLTRGQVSASACSACKPPDGWLGLRPSFSDSFTRYDPRCLSGRRHLLFGRQSQKPVRDLLVANLGCGAIAFCKPGFCDRGIRAAASEVRPPRFTLLSTDPGRACIRWRVGVARATQSRSVTLPTTDESAFSANQARAGRQARARSTRSRDECRRRRRADHGQIAWAHLN
jgi:hypothetical protein